MIRGPVFRRQTEEEHVSIYAVPVRGRTGYLKLSASKITGDICVSIELATKPDATGHSGPEDDDDDGA
jgi:hypothetical protein